MLIRQKDGATGNLDKLYPLVMGPRNGWLGGDGDQQYYNATGDKKYHSHSIWVYATANLGVPGGEGVRR